MNNLKNKFSKNGYVKIKNFLSNKEKKLIKDVIYERFKKHLFLTNKNKLNLEDKKFHKKLILLRKKSPKKFGEIYDNISLNSKFRSLFYNEKFIKIFSKILNVNSNQIFITGFMMRLDAPNDKRNKLDWHQDSSYYMMAYPKFNAGVCWCAITKNDEKNGTLIFVPKFRSKFYKTNSIKKKNNLTTEQNIVKITKKELHETKNLSQNFGDVSFLHMNLKHRSGENNSEKVRISIACRFIDMSKSFNSGKEIYHFNNKRFN